MAQPSTPKINVFRNKNFSLLFAGVLVSNIAHILFSFAISLYILSIASQAYGIESAALIQALYLAVNGLFLVLLMPFGGAFADKLNKVKIMVWTDLIRAVVILGIAYYLFTAPDVITIIIVLFVMNVLLAVNSAFFNPASSSLLRFIVKDEELQQAASYLQGSHNLQALIGLILGGIMYATLGIVWIFLVNGLGYLVSAISEIFIRYDHLEHGGSDVSVKGMLADIRYGLKYLRGEKAIFTILMMALGLNFFLTPIFSNGMPFFIEFGLGQEPVYLFDGFMRPANWYSVIMIGFSISAIFMSLFMSRQKTKARYSPMLKKALGSMVGMIALLSILMVLYYMGIIPVNVILVSLAFIMFAVGVSQIAFNVPVQLIFQRKVDKTQLGKVNSVSAVLSQALVPLASLVAGLLISQLSIIAFYLFCLIGMVVVLLLYVTNPNADLL